MKRTLAAMFALFVLASCGTDGTEVNEDAPAAKKEAVSIDSQAVVESFDSQDPREISEMGDASTWHPYFEGVEDRSASAITLNLSVPGDIDGGDQKDLAEKAGTDIFNFVGEEFPELQQIVVFVDGRDRATINRSDIPLLNL